MKKLIAFILIAVMLFTNAYATFVEVNVGGMQVNSLNSEGETKMILIEEIPYISESGRTMVPVRAVTESFGAEVSWNEENREVQIKRGEDVISLTIDSAVSLVNGVEMMLDSAPEIKGGRTFVPLRFIGEALGYNINYVASTKQIMIDDTKVLFKVGDAVVTMAELQAFYDIYWQISYANGKKSGATDDEIKAAAFAAAYEAAMGYVIIHGTFPATLDENDIKTVNDNITYDENLISVPLKGISALCHEKLYYSGGMPAIKAVAASDEVKLICEENYIRAKHILVDNEETAEEVLAKIAAGNDYDELVKEYGKDPGMERNADGYVFTKGEMVKEFEEAAFNLPEGEVSVPVKSQFGYHIIKREALGEIPAEIKEGIAEQIVSIKLSNITAPEALVSEEELGLIVQ